MTFHNRGVRMEEILLLKLGEVVLKGLNRGYFEQKLETAVKRRLKPFGDFKVYTSQSTIYAEPQGSADIDGAFSAATRVFGIVSVSRAVGCPKEKDAIADTAIRYLAGEMRRAKSFKVESKRADKRFPMTSIQLSQYVGGLLADAFPGTAVDVHSPELTVNVEVRDFFAYVHAGGAPGAGGLPEGSSGRAVTLLSGGIDSPVASYLIARRGMRLIPVHFFSFPYTSELAKEKVLRLTELLGAFCGRLTLEVVPFTKIQEEIRRKCPEEYFTLLMRRFMMRIAEKIGASNGCSALVTGENLGQVASQTIEAMAATEAVVSLPVLKPLVGLDKEDIVRMARKIGTYDTSVLPYEDCCTIFTPRHPKTKPRLAEVERAESRLDVQALVDEAVAGIERIRVGE